MRSKLLTSLVMLIMSVSLMAQNVAINGVVVDKIGPVIGASVLEKGTTNGTMTDLDGKFSLTVKPGATIVISSIGYSTREIAVNGQTSFSVTLEEDSEFLDEVVVVGYGTMKKSDLSGSSVSMKEEDLKGTIVSSLDQTLQGRAAGVQAVQTSGAPGSSSSIRVDRLQSTQTQNLSTSSTVSSYRAEVHVVRTSVSVMRSVTVPFPPSPLFQQSTLPIS